MEHSSALSFAPTEKNPSFFEQADDTKRIHIPKGLKKPKDKQNLINGLLTIRPTIKNKSTLCPGECPSHYPRQKQRY